MCPLGSFAWSSPLLPEWLEQVTVRNILLRGDHVDVRVSRAAGQTAVTTLSRTGELRVASIS
jgi:hypothetical protein